MIQQEYNENKWCPEYHKTSSMDDSGILMLPISFDSSVLSETVADVNIWHYVVYDNVMFMSDTISKNESL